MHLIFPPPPPLQLIQKIGEAHLTPRVVDCRRSDVLLGGKNPLDDVATSFIVFRVGGGQLPRRPCAKKKSEKTSIDAGTSTLAKKFGKFQDARANPCSSAGPPRVLRYLVGIVFSRGLILCYLKRLNA